MNDLPITGLQTAVAAAPGRNHRILVVDDNEAIHEDFRKILMPAGRSDTLDAEEADLFGSAPRQVPALQFDLSFASQGTKAVQMVRAARQDQVRFSLVFMDVRMPPGWDGLDTARKLWEIDADLQVVICTAHSDKSWHEMMAILGNPERVLILKKPFEAIEVLQLSHALTEKWSLVQAARRNLADLERAVDQRTRELLAANQRLELETAAHKRAAERVLEQAMLLEKARDAIIVWDLDGTIRYWNSGAESIYGWSPAEVRGRKIFDLLDSGGAGDVLEAARREVVEAGNWSGDLQQKTRGGGLVTAACRWTLVRDDDGQPKSILGINTDVTEKKLLEAKFLRAQRLDGIGTLAAGIAHDLNNVLHPVTLAMDFIRTKLGDPAALDMLDLVSSNARRATALVQQVLSFAEGVGGERAAIRPDELAGEIAGIVRGTFPKNIVLQFHPAQGTWPILGDANQLHQVLLNLCVNARDAMPGGGTLSLVSENVLLDGPAAAIQPDATAGPHVMLAISDTGCGIPTNVRDKIFDPFFTTKGPGKGSGLGLSTSLGIVRSHGGFISVHTQTGTGTSFRVFIPAVAAGSVTLRESADPGMPRGNGELILIVDDEAAIVSIMRHTLEAFGYRTVTAGDGAEGLRVYQESGTAVDAVITDMAMPSMDGPAMIRALRQIDPAARIVASTGMTSRAGIQAIAELEVDGVLSKPCAAADLLVKVHEVLQAAV